MQLLTVGYLCVAVQEVSPKVGSEKSTRRRMLKD